MIRLLTTVGLAAVGAKPRRRVERTVRALRPVLLLPPRFTCWP